MVKKSSAITACVIVCVCTFLIASVLTGAAGIFYLNRTGQLQSVKEQPSPTGTATQALDYDRLTQIANVYHTLALTDVPNQKLLDGAAEGMALGSGDKYSEFFTVDEFKQFTQEEAGNYVGIGVSVNVDAKDKLITAITVYKGSPAEKGGMLPGDKIVKINGKDVTLMDLDSVVNLVKGQSGTQVNITVLRGQDTKELTMTRANVTMDFVDPPKMLSNNIGYIKILEFNGNAAVLFDKYVKQLQAQGMKGLILDLRNNPGGSLNIVAPIADELFPAGPIVTMVDKSGKEVPGSRIESDANHLGLPMVVLVNENSASASELLSGGIQDDKVGTLIGVTTYGKGVAQSFFTLPDGSVLKYTADKYLTSGGRCPQSVGIKPDIVVELAQAVKDNPLLLCTDQDNQYQKAIEQLGTMIQGK